MRTLHDRHSADIPRRQRLVKGAGTLKRPCERAQVAGGSREGGEQGGVRGEEGGGEERRGDGGASRWCDRRVPTMRARTRARR